MARNFARPCAGHSPRAAPTNCQMNCRFRRPEWAVPYRVLAGTLGLPAELAEAYRIAAALVGPALQGQAIGMWIPVTQHWTAPRERA